MEDTNILCNPNKSGAQLINKGMPWRVGWEKNPIAHAISK